ncbi:MAG: hypothetical protein CMJ35_01320 [Phycisphaerae bacterium]|nr:hypothetical protein [Phycisphaerae bacterium]MBM90239.1 hypothetical protein [Phycisphaerae bacterium]
MNTKTVAIATITLGASALGGVLLFTGGGAESKNNTPTQPTDQFAQASNFDAPPMSSDFDTPEVERGQINTQGRNNANQNNGRGGFADMLDRMTEFDLDGDGILSEEERRAMRDAMRAEMMARFDLDGDGEISREERMAARQAMFEDSPRGQELMRQFDADGNGVLDEEEQAAMEAFQEQEREERRAEEIARYDTDGDGELSREERQVQREEQGRGRGREAFEQARTEFDSDGDGVLSIEETQEAFTVMQERREIERFVNNYDSDGNGTMGPADYSAFLANYEQGSMSADVNGDGTVNSQDLAAYTDMVTRSRNNP